MKTRDKYIYNYNNKENNIMTIGLMSGTSMDGVDVALVKTDGFKNFKIKNFETFCYSDEIRKLLQKSIRLKINLSSLSEVITNFHINSIKLLLKKYGLSVKNIDLIGFHGQTIMHHPAEGWTWQLGNGQDISNELKIPVISNFRYRDVCLGGEGAPLVAIWHKILANSIINQKYPCIFLNIGGVSNITYIEDCDNVSYCFDIGIGNGPIDQISQQYFSKIFDHDGNISLSGNINYSVLKDILKHQWFTKKPPKSIDRNEFNKFIFSCLEGISARDKLATLSKLVALSLKSSINFLNLKPKCIYISGGGRYNKAIMHGLKDEFGNIIFKMEENNWNGDAIEAQAFAYLAVRSIKSLPLTINNLTGLSRDVSGGVLSLPIT